MERLEAHRRACDVLAHDGSDPVRSAVRRVWPPGLEPARPASRAANAAIPAAPQCQDGSARRRRRRADPALVPERPEPVAARLRTEPGQRRTGGRAVGRRVDTRVGEVLEHPADPGGTAVETDMQRGGRIARQLVPGAPLTAARLQPDARPARDLAVRRVARRPRGLQIDPRDPGDAELEARRGPGAVAACERPADRAPRIRHGLIVDPGEEPARRREIGRIAIAPVALEEHERGSGRAGEEAGLVRRALVRAARQRARSVRGQLPQPRGARARVGAEGRVAGAVGERVEREDDARLAHADAVVARRARPDRPSSATSKRSPGTTALRSRDQPAHARERGGAETRLVCDLVQPPEVVADPGGAVVEAREVRRRTGVRPDRPSRASAGLPRPARPRRAGSRPQPRRHAGSAGRA